MRPLFVYVPLGPVLAGTGGGPERLALNLMGVVGRAEHEQTVKFSMDATRRECANQAPIQDASEPPVSFARSPGTGAGGISSSSSSSYVFTATRLRLSALKAERSKKKSSSHGGMGWGKTKGGPGPLPR